MRAFYLLVLISFLLYGMGAVTDLGGEPYTDEEDFMVESPEGYAAGIHGFLDSPVTVFQPDLSEESVNAEDDGIEVQEFFPDCEDCGSAKFHFGYEKGSGVHVFGAWNGVGFDLEPEMDEMEENYYNGDLSEDAAWYMTTADLDGDRTPELLVALHDGVIDGVLKIYKIRDRIDTERKSPLAFRAEEVGDLWFQNDIHIDENAHIVVKIGSQGLYEEYGLEDGKLWPIYSPSSP